MSPVLQSALERLQTDNYKSLAMMTAVVYDYLLTFPREIDYIWRKPWTWVSTMFLIVRYAGLMFAIIYALFGSAFMPGPQRSYSCKHINWLLSTVMHEYSEGAITYPLAMILAFIIFLTAADFIMILRVYAMWNRSKTIFYVLLLVLVAQTILASVLGGIYYDNPNTHLSVRVAYILNISFCTEFLVNIPPLLFLGLKLPRIILGTALLVLAIVQTLKQSIEMYEATKQWQPNRYMQVLVRDGVIYFLMNVLINAINWIQISDTVTNIWILSLYSFGWITMCAMMPRFIISVRELQDSGLPGRLQGIDTGFGVLFSAIDIGDAAPGQGQAMEWEADEPRGIRLEERGDNMDQV